MTQRDIKLSGYDREKLEKSIELLEPLCSLAQQNHSMENGLSVRTEGANPSGSVRISLAGMRALIEGGRSLLNGEKSNA